MQSEPQSTCSAAGIRVAIIVSDYHHNITSRLAEVAVQTFTDAGGCHNDVSIMNATGAWELPILAKSMTTGNKVDAIVALGCIIAGETTHDEIIGHAIAQGLMSIAIEWGHPVSMGILTCQTLTQAEDRSGGTAGNKGREAMLAAIGTANTLRKQQQ